MIQCESWCGTLSVIWFRQRRCRLACRLSDPQEAHLGAEVGSVPDVREEGLGVTGGAGRHAGPLRRRVVMDVFRQDAASLKEKSATGSGTFDRVSKYRCVWSYFSLAFIFYSFV